MSKILIAVDGSPNALRGVAHIINQTRAGQPGAEIHLINVQHPLHGGISSFISAGQIRQLHQEEGEKALFDARKMLDDAGIAYQHHLFIGDPAHVMVQFANDGGFDEIVIGTRGLSAVSNMLLGSVSAKLAHLANMPVLLVK
ncbi:universal stress protein [Noviherbaspirillum sedimenti]|uniref:Universal stress protein n=1 Tax=Noviherbaspirillum sedimenti TaxID=2320865 RepID=A0A3A3G7W7_9BURK|nr:universal stress protein [Noviherbaspirillum sedimenti]RJG03725.1 universal stress protein [Noviherbaspirillum sedimenti]